MSTPLTINGVIFNYPQNFDINWGVDATGWAQAVTAGMLQKAGGSFPLTADVDFGASFGLKSAYFESRSANPATTGTVRLSSADAGVAFRNNANSGNLILTTNSSDNLLYNGQVVALSGSGSGSSPTFTNATLSNSLILDDTEMTPKTVTVSAPAILSTNWSLKFPINPGLSGQVLQTDGSGNTSWVNAAGGGTVNTGTAGNFTYYATSTNAVSDSGISISTPTFSGLVNGNAFRSAALSNQLSFTNAGGGNQVRTINVAPTTTVGEVITVPDPGASANFILSAGTPTFSAPVSMGSNQINNVANGSAPQDAVAFNQVSSLPSGSGSTNTLTKWTGSSTLGNSNLTDTGTIATVPGSTQVRLGQVGTFGQSSSSAIEMSVGSGSTYGVAFSGGSLFKPQHFISVGPSEFSTSSTSSQTFWTLNFSATDAGSTDAFIVEIRMFGQDTTVSPRTLFAATYMFALSVNNAGTAFTQVGATATIFQVSNLANLPTFGFGTPTGASPSLMLNINPGNSHITEWEAVAFITRMASS